MSLLSLEAILLKLIGAIGISRLPEEAVAARSCTFKKVRYRGANSVCDGVCDQGQFDYAPLGKPT